MDGRADILRGMNVCRFCLCNEESQLTNIYKKLGNDSKHSVPLPLQIMACISIEVFESDGMPQLICYTCRKLTMQAYTFKTNCKKADDALKLFLATGQLAKPFMHRIEQFNILPTSMKTSANKDANKESKNESAPKSQAAKHFSANVDKDIPMSNMRENWTMMEEDTEELERILEMTSSEMPNKQRNCEQKLEEDEDEEFRSGDDIVKNEKVSDSSSQLSMEKTGVTQVPTECFPCPHCERSFPLKQLLDLHVQIHTRERAFECDICHRRFFTKYDLQKHMTTHEDAKPFSCVVCFKSFARETVLRRHERTHDNVPRYVCTYCDRTFLTKEFLDQHMDRHRKKKPFVCKICNKSFVFKQGLERHELIHSENKPHKCNYCEASFTSAIKLTRHITSHAGLRPYPCKLCGRTFLLSHHLTRHMRSHYAIQGSNKSGLLVNQYKCDLCSMSFRRKDSLVNHSVIHSMVNLKCVICYTSFESAALVKEHITNHLAGLPFPCDKCDYSFETSEQLEEHALKHAEMEYEDQIEREVLSEAMQQKVDEDEDEEANMDIGDGDENIVSMRMDELDDEEVQEFTITDIENPEVVPRDSTAKDKGNNAQSTENEQPEPFSYFLKDELSSDSEEDALSGKNTTGDNGEAEESDIDTEVIKPIVRQEGTKVYQRRTPVSKTVPQVNKEPVKVEESSKQVQPNVQIDNIGALNSQSLSMQSNTTKMKMGEKVVQVRKFIVTKEEMKAMAKEGILELKGNRVFLKNPGAPILNATLKPIQKIDIDSILDKSKESRQQIKQYQKKNGSDKAEEQSKN